MRIVHLPYTPKVLCLAQVCVRACACVFLFPDMKTAILLEKDNEEPAPNAFKQVSHMGHVSPFTRPCILPGRYLQCKHNEKSPTIWGASHRVDENGCILFYSPWRQTFPIRYCPLPFRGALRELQNHEKNIVRRPAGLGLCFRFGFAISVGLRAPHWRKL